MMLLRDATPEQLVRAAARNHAALWQYEGGEVHTDDGISWLHSPRDGYVTVVFPSLLKRTADDTLDTLVAKIRECRPQRVAWWSLLPTKPRDLGVRLAARGFEWGWQPQWMALDLRGFADAFPAPDGVIVTPADDAPVWDVADLPYYTRPAAPVISKAKSPRFFRFAAWRDGRVVGQSGVYLTAGRNGVAGIYNVGVVPAARNQGIGRAITAAACAFARSQGYRYALLNAATGIYAKIGFVSLGYGQTWWLHAPALAAPPPTQAQIRFAEAVGRGLRAALRSLSSSDCPDDLDAPLPNGMTPMELAIKCQKPKSVGWLLSQGATLEILHAWNLGWRDRVPAMLHSHPDLASRPSGKHRMTPLHEAALRGDTELARLILATCPDLTARETQFNGTPLDWARHFGRAEIVSLIEQQGD